MIVTGGVRGFGRRIVEQFVAAKALVTAFDLNREGLEQLRDQLPQVNCVECDVSANEQVVAAIDRYYEKFGSPDILINNAGLLYSEPLVKLTPMGIQKHDVAAWNRVISTNLSSVFHITSCVAEKMVSTRTKGVIVNISSVSAAGNSGQSAYSAAKAGVNALTAVWAKELSFLGIRVVSVSPGFSDTASTSEVLSEAVLRETIKKVPLRRLGTPDEIAEGVLFVVKNDFFNGKVLELDGGLVL